MRRKAFIYERDSLETDMLIPCSEQEEKVNRIYETYKRLMLYAAYQILGNSEDAEDALQMAMLGICRNAVQIDLSVTEQEIRSYVMTAVQNAAFIFPMSHILWKETMLRSANLVQAVLPLMLIKKLPSLS